MEEKSQTGLKGNADLKKERKKAAVRQRTNRLVVAETKSAEQTSPASAAE